MNSEPGANGTILVVDDLPATISLVRTALEERGYDVLVATNGAEALQRAALTAPDLILLDILMPGIDGYDTCTQLKAQAATQQIPVIFMTMVTETVDKVKGFQLGAVDYLTKPLDVEELVARVKTHLTIARLQQELQAVNAGLEQQVAARTAELRAANGQLQIELTERKQVEEALRRLNRELRALSDCNQVLIRAVDEQTLLNNICRIVCDVAGYRMAWVGYAEHDDAHTVRPVAWAGVEEGYLASARITWADAERGRGVTGTVIRTGANICIQDFMADPQAALWRENALQRGYRSSLAVPLKDEHAAPFGALTIYATESNAFTPDEIRLLEELADDLAFGIVTLRTRAERKRAEEALKDQYSTLRSIIDSANALIFSVDRQYRYTSFNTAHAVVMCVLYGAEIEIGRSLLEYMTVTEDRKTAKRNLDRAFAGEQLVEEAYSGDELRSRQYFQVSHSPIKTETGEIIGVAVLAQDMTERKRAEAEVVSLKNYLTNIIDSMPSILVGIDHHELVTRWNRRAEELTGIPDTATVGQPIAALLPEFAPWIEALRSEIAQQHRPAAREHILIEQAGERRFYDLMLYPLIANGVEGAVIRIEDVTERVRVRELLMQTEKMTSVAGLAAGLAHEINNPLGIILQAAQNIDRRISPDLPANRQAADALGLSLERMQTYFAQRQIPEFLGSIRTAAARGVKIVANMLRFSRVETIKRPASLSVILEQAIELAASDYDLKKKYDFRSIKIIRDYAPEMPDIPVVAVEIEQVLLNLLKNAAQAMIVTSVERAPQITLRLCRDKRYAVIEVEDNGPGMDETIRRRVFEPFFTTREPGIGTGLGLSVSYMIITQNHKGLLEVASTPGNGACFTVRLPLTSQTREDTS